MGCQRPAGALDDGHAHLAGAPGPPAGRRRARGRGHRPGRGRGRSCGRGTEPERRLSEEHAGVRLLVAPEPAHDDRPNDHRHRLLHLRLRDPAAAVHRLPGRPRCAPGPHRVQLAVMLVLGLVMWVLASSVQAALLPGLGLVHSTESFLSGQAVSNTIPGPVDLAVRYILYRQWGHAPEPSSLSIVLAGVFDQLAALEHADHRRRAPRSLRGGGPDAHDPRDRRRRDHRRHLRRRLLGPAVRTVREEGRRVRRAVPAGRLPLHPPPDARGIPSGPSPSAPR